MGHVSPCHAVGYISEIGACLVVSRAIPIFFLEGGGAKIRTWSGFHTGFSVWGGGGGGGGEIGEGDKYL